MYIDGLPATVRGNETALLYYVCDYFTGEREGYICMSCGLRVKVAEIERSPEWFRTETPFGPMDGLSADLG